MKHIICGCTLAIIAPLSLSAQSSDSSMVVKFGAFIDGYYAYDMGRPPLIDRAFTTQAARHNEFNINLAFVEAKLQSPRVRARLALQAGTSVQSNYAGEYAVGVTSGPSLARHIQEAVVGVQVAKNLWVDGGIFFSHIGMEGYISRDNPTYTRSLAAEFTPYYESGVKLTWQPTTKLTLLGTVVNGWQNISENNQEKGVGLRVDFSLTSEAVISYYNFFGNEVSSSRLRTLNGIGMKVMPQKRLTILANIDYGTQQRAIASGTDTWYAGALIASATISDAVAINARVERYDDKSQVIVSTGTPNGFRISGMSFGVDTKVAPQTLWRTEIRGLKSRDAVFSSRKATSGMSTGNGLIVTSLAITL